MPRHSENMKPFKTTLRDGRPDDNPAALNDLQEIWEGSDEGSFDTGELQFNLTINSESDCCDAEKPAGSSVNNADNEASEFGGFLCEIQGVMKTQDRLERGLKVLKINYQRDNMVIMEALQEDKLRCDALEQQLTNLTESFQREIVNLKRELSSIKENINCGTRETDVHETLVACHTRLLNVELQQQQPVQVEMPEDTTAWVVLRKIISVLLVVLTAMLVFVSTLSHFVILLKPSGHMLSALLFTILLYILWKYWDSL